MISHLSLVSFDKDKCEIILSNLLINALKHSPQDTEITITSELLPEEKRVRISITDQGCGLQQVDTQKLFTRFYQGMGEQSGTGIGLLQDSSGTARRLHRRTRQFGIGSYLLLRTTAETGIGRDHLPAQSISE